MNDKAGRKGEGKGEGNEGLGSQENATNRNQLTYWGACLVTISN